MPRQSCTPISRTRATFARFMRTPPRVKALLMGLMAVGIGAPLGVWAESTRGDNGLWVFNKGDKIESKTVNENFASVMGAATAGGRSPSYGADMWTQLMGQKGLFTPHEDNCDDTEAFVPIAPSSDAPEIGYCMERGERDDALFEYARDKCLSAGKRLPEPMEFKFACEQASSLGLSDMVNGWEWSTNFPIYMIDGDSGQDASLSGSGGCNYSSGAWIASGGGSEGKAPYRCLR